MPQAELLETAKELIEGFVHENDDPELCKAEISWLSAYASREQVEMTIRYQVVPLDGKELWTWTWLEFELFSEIRTSKEQALSNARRVADSLGLKLEAE